MKYYFICVYSALFLSTQENGFHCFKKKEKIKYSLDHAVFVKEYIG